MRILLHGLNYWPEELGIGKYSGEMVQHLAQAGHDVTVVTTPPYYPQWKVWSGFRRAWYQSEMEPVECAGKASGKIHVIRCPLWVPKKVSGLKRIIHLASFGISSVPPMLWEALTGRHDIVMTVEPAAFCMPTTWLSARLARAKAWLHVQDFEVDAAFELGILKQPLLKRFVLAVESFLMRRFDRVSSISPNMVDKLSTKKVADDRCVLFPNWVDSNAMQPLEDPLQYRQKFGIPSDKCIAMYAGNIGAKQGLEILLEAARAATENADLHFVICGTGAKVEQFKKDSQDLANVQWLEPQSFEVFNQLMNCADIHLLPQRSGAADLVMPSKLTGMLATGRPVVAGADPGTQIANVVADHGLVVAAGDSQGFYQAIVYLASNVELRSRLGDSARSYAVHYLGKKAILDQFEQKLQELCYSGQKGEQLVATMAQPHISMDTQVNSELPKEEKWQK